MESFVELDVSGAFVRVTTQGSFTVDGYIDMVDTILAQSFFLPGTSVLFDHRGLDFGATTVDTIRRTSDYHLTRNADIGDGRAAIVMAEALAFGTARQFKSMIEHRASARLQIFRDTASAESWLKGSDAPHPVAG